MSKSEISERKEVFAEEKRFIFHCASGCRSPLSAANFSELGIAASHLKQGFSDWE
ncbi:MAG: rhodanese-like domain-containing protein [Pseudomonadota bacterium]